MSGAGPRHVAVFDVGKTNAKVVLLDGRTGAEIGIRKRPNTVSSDGPYPHFDIEGLWTFLLESLTDFVREPGFGAICVTTHGASGALVGEDGGLALPVLDYEYRYPEAVRSEYARLRPDFAETLSPSLPGGLNLGAQLYFQKTLFPQAFERTSRIVTYPQYWAGRLTGVAATEVTSLGCHTDLWNPRAGTWSSLVDRLDLRGRMAGARSAFDVLGMVREPVAERIGLNREVPVHCGIHDSNASLLPHLVDGEVPLTVISTGTWVIMFALGGDAGRLRPELDILANVDAYGRPVPSARFMGGRAYERLAGGWGGGIEGLEGAVRGGVMVVPGEGEDYEEARWINAEGADGATRHAAVCLAMALSTRAYLDAINAEGSILVEGPFAENDLFLGALEALTGRSVAGLPSATGTSLGAGMLAGIRPPGETARRVAPRLDASGLAGYAAAWQAERRNHRPGR